MRTAVVSALNIVMPIPHSSDRYIDLFHKAYKMRAPIKVRGDLAGMIGACRDEESDGSKIVVGELYKYLELQLDKQWYNTLQNKAADESELAQIKIPGHLKPHFEISPFVFFPKKHRLFFISKETDLSFTPNQVCALFKGLFETDSISREFVSMEITIEPSVDALDRIFNLQRIKALQISISPPNPDDQDVEERRIMERLNLLNANKQNIEFQSNHINGLQLDRETKVLAKIAQSNGSVSGRGEDVSGNLINISTQTHPLEEKFSYDPNIQTRLRMLIAAAYDMLPNILKRD